LMLPLLCRPSPVAPTSAQRKRGLERRPAVRGEHDSGALYYDTDDMRRIEQVQLATLVAHPSGVTARPGLLAERVCLTAVISPREITLSVANGGRR
jgi:hypothetical protein